MANQREVITGVDKENVNILEFVGGIKKGGVCVTLDEFEIIKQKVDEVLARINLLTE